MSLGHYKSSIIKVSNYEIIRLKRDESASWLSIIPKYGCALNEFICNGVSILLNASNRLELKKNTINAFAGTQLFPYPCRVNNAMYSYKGKQFKLPKNDSPRKHSLHGLIYNKPFIVDAIDHLRGKIDCSYIYNKTIAGFPFKAKISNCFQLLNNGLTLTTTVSNIGNKTFPFGQGWHPYFKTGDNTNEWLLQIPSKERYFFNDTLIPTGKTQKSQDFLTESPIGDRNIDYCFKLEDDEDALQVFLKSPKKNITIILDIKGYNFLQVYIPPDRKSIALEPLTCVPDALNNQIGLMFLKPDEKVTLSFSIKVLQ